MMWIKKRNNSSVKSSVCNAISLTQCSQAGFCAPTVYILQTHQTYSRRRKTRHAGSRLMNTECRGWPLNVNTSKFKHWICGWLWNSFSAFEWFYISNHMDTFVFSMFNGAGSVSCSNLWLQTLYCPLVVTLTLAWRCEYRQIFAYTGYMHRSGFSLSLQQVANLSSSRLNIHTYIGYTNIN